jgi:hypothetical protein
MDFKKMLTAYDDLNDPVNIRLHYKTNEEFIWWLEARTKDELVVLLWDFQNIEFYEDCAVILKMIKFKKKQK